MSSNVLERGTTGRYAYKLIKLPMGYRLDVVNKKTNATVNHAFLLEEEARSAIQDLEIRARANYSQLTRASIHQMP